MSFLIVHPPSFTKEAVDDKNSEPKTAFQLAAEWLSAQAAAGWEPMAVTVLGTDGCCQLVGDRRTKSPLVLRRVSRPAAAPKRKAKS